MTKRIVLMLGIILASTALVCAGGQTEGEEEERTGEAGAAPTTYNEAPALAELVEQGQLPSVDERLPVDLQVVTPVDSVGQYGGTLRTVDINNVEIFGIVKHGLFALAQDFEAGTHNWNDGIAEGKIVPDLAAGGEFNADFTRFTLYLREGMRWSDGVPVTADDFMFWWEDIVNNEEVVPDVPTIYRPGGEIMEVTKVDDYTIQIDFAVPHKFFQYYLCDTAVRQMPLRPRHFLEQYHIDYNEDAAELASEAGYETWHEYFGVMGGDLEPDYEQVVEMPTLFPWITTTYEPDQWVGERNPYYFRVDTEGNQLPYIDRVVAELSTNREVLTAKVVAGQVDYSAVALPFSEIPTLRSSEERGDYTTRLWDVPMGAMPSVLFNQSLNEEVDPFLRELFKDVRFRRAMSMAINREEANEVAYFGLSEPRQATVLPGSRFGEPEYYTAYADYDPGRANELLDEIGLEWDANNEWRLRPDNGQRLTIVLEDADVGAIRGYSRIRPLLKEYWAAVGVDVVLSTSEVGIWFEKMTNNNVQLTMWGLDNFNDYSIQILGPWIIPGTSYGGFTWHAPGWHQWVVSDGREGEEPPEEVLRMRELWERMNASTDEDEITELGKEIFGIQAEYIHVIGVVGAVRQPIVVKNGLRNFPEGVWSNTTSLGGYAWAFQWYFE